MKERTLNLSGKRKAFPKFPLLRLRGARGVMKERIHILNGRMLWDTALILGDIEGEPPDFKSELVKN